MATVVDAHRTGTGAHRHMRDHLTGPLQAGALDHEVAIDAGGRATTWSARQPLLLVAARTDLTEGDLTVEAVLDPDGAATELPALHFPRHTRRGAFLPLHVPAVDGLGVAGPLTVELAVVGPHAGPVADVIELRLVEGNLGRLAYLLGAEKGRIRRQAAELAAVRVVDDARDDALDRHGRDLAVPRFADTLAFTVDPAGNGAIVTEERREPDDEYRARLSLYRPLLRSSPRRAHLLLNGPGPDDAPNEGLLARAGLAARVRLAEQDNPFAIAVHLVAAGAPDLHAAFEQHARETYLVEPATDVPAHRFLPAAARQAQNELRQRLRDRFQLPAGTAIVPLLARSLDVLGRCRAELLGPAPLPVLEPLPDSPASRYQLGLGVDLPPPAPADLAAMAAALSDPNRPPAPSAAIEGVLRAMAPQPPADDPEGRWLLGPCGLRTAHRLAGDRMYVSHLPVFGLAVTGASVSGDGNPVDVELEARFHAPGDPGKDAALHAALAAAAKAWEAAGHDEWTSIADPDAPGAWALAIAPPAAVASLLAAASLPAVADPAPVVDALERLPAELLETIELPPGLAAAVLAADPAAVSDLEELRAVLTKAGAAAALPLLTSDDRVLVVVSVIGLPDAGINLGQRRATGFRWAAVPVTGPGGSIRTVGSRTVFTPQGTGLTAIVVIGYSRRGATDPYEIEAVLPEGAVLDLLQYEMLMNALDHLHPAGVEVNTFAIRTGHVDIDGDGAADRLDPRAARTYRRYRRRRFRGEGATGP